MPNFQPGQIVTVFRSRLRPENSSDYEELAPQILSLAQESPGLVDVKTFTAEDGERVTVVTFADEQTHQAWKTHADHRLAQKRGREDFYAEFSLQVCQTVRVTSFRHDPVL